MDLKLLALGNKQKTELNLPQTAGGNASPQSQSIKNSKLSQSTHSFGKRPLKVSMHIVTQHTSNALAHKLSQFNSPMPRGYDPNRSFAPSTAEDGLNNYKSSVVLDGDASGEGQQAFLRVKQDLDDTLKDLDTKLNRVLQKQEYEYLKGYNIYVKKKEKELRELIKRLNDKNMNATFKDEKMQGMEKTINGIREEQMKTEKQKQELRQKIGQWKQKAEAFESEKNFLYTQVMENKRKNKLLKVAIGRLQMEIDQLTKLKETKEKQDLEIQKSQFFITDLKQAFDQPLKTSPRLNISTQLDSSRLHDISTTNQSLLEPSGILTNRQIGGKQMHRRLQSNSVSRYANIPTENIKFTKFIELLYKSKMTLEEQKQEIISYVQALETNYNSTIQDMKDKCDRLVRQVKLARGEQANNFHEKMEMEGLFIDCIEDVRKQVMKRQLKQQIMTRKKVQQIDYSQSEAQEFEESLMKLANLAKNRIKISDFNAKDRFNILDLFVNNEKTLVKMYDALFPHKNLKQSQQKEHGHLLNRYGYQSGTAQSSIRGNTNISFNETENPNILVNMSQELPMNIHEDSKSGVILPDIKETQSAVNKSVNGLRPSFLFKNLQ